MKKDNLGDRVKFFEGASEPRLFPGLPTLARLDGKAFHNFTRGMNLPYDVKLSQAMINTTIALVKETNAKIGYTQSDEISLAWYEPDKRIQIWFDYRFSKMVSTLSAYATLVFYREVVKSMPEYADRMPTFDARVWQVPNTSEAANAFLWRETDAFKNSQTQAARCYYGDKELFKKTGSQKQEMLFQKGINFNNYPSFFKRGSYVQRRTVIGKLSDKERENLPPRHNARTDKDFSFERSVIEVIDMPVFSTVTNREGVIFSGEKPKTK